jgi:hypothetical protein
MCWASASLAAWRCVRGGMMRRFKTLMPTIEFVDQSFDSCRPTRQLACLGRFKDVANGSI